MLDLETVTQFVLENFEQVQISNHGTHFLARCRLCGDSVKNKYKKRFNLDWNNGVPGWNCFNCSRHGNFYELYSRLKGVSYEDAKKELYKFDKDKIKRYISDKDESKKSRTKETKITEDNFN
jgi:hypothetical protein